MGDLQVRDDSGIARPGDSKRVLVSTAPVHSVTLHVRGGDGRPDDRGGMAGTSRLAMAFTVPACSPTTMVDAAVAIPSRVGESDRVVLHD
ncbi:MAG: hypothetical protein AMS20_11415 [Gemmatimonas sp. SG8_28]|nr:MAG: hypothetical protein AMS20_11415 [Gemmatimonas sp. SG8_28]